MKELCQDPTVWCSGWEMLSMIVDSLARDFLSSIHLTYKLPLASPISCWASSCLAQSTPLPSTPLYRRLQTTPQPHKRSSVVACTQQRMPVSSACTSNSDPSCNVSQCCQSSPVYCLWTPRYLYVLTLSMSSLWMFIGELLDDVFPAEVDPYLLCLAGINLKVIQLTPVDKVHDDLPVLTVIPLWHTSHNGSVMGVLPEVATVRGMCEVRRVQGKEEKWENCSMRDTSTTDHHIGHTVLQLHKLRPVSEVAGDPWILLYYLSQFNGMVAYSNILLLRTL